LTRGSSEIAVEIGNTPARRGDRPDSGTIYVEAKTKEVSGLITNYVHRLHALDITTGAKSLAGPGDYYRPRFPATATEQRREPGFNGLRHLNRCALLLQ